MAGKKTTFSLHGGRCASQLVKEHFHALSTSNVMASKNNSTLPNPIRSVGALSVLNAEDAKKGSKIGVRVLCLNLF